jgi:O-antigen ligase
MFKNPNDLALNMVAVLPFASMLAMRSVGGIRRLMAAGCGVLMAGAVVASHSRSGTIGLAMMLLVFGASVARRRPGMAIAGALVLMLALPLLPGSYWHRLSSITDETRDDTGSREARQIVFWEAVRAFAQHPLTGVGAGQFKNYDPEGRQEAWRESHNVVLQVAAELGALGLATFLFLVTRAALARSQTRALLRRAQGSRPRPWETTRPVSPLLSVAEADWLQSHSAAATAALAGWFFCALFASVAYNWTFYILLALAIAPREILRDRLASLRTVRQRPLDATALAVGARA